MHCTEDFFCPILIDGDVHVPTTPKDVASAKSLGNLTDQVH